MANNFSMKTAQKAETTSHQGTNAVAQASPEAWLAWNEYLYTCFNAKEAQMNPSKVRKEKTLIGKVNLIMDLGTPPAADSTWATKCAIPTNKEDGSYTDEELAYLEKNPTHDFIWKTIYNEKTKMRDTVRMQTSPAYPQQEFGIAVDFPQILVDYSKHPNSTTTTPDLRPYRISLNGSFHSPFPKVITFDGTYREVNDRNLVYRICAAAGRKEAMIDTQFDIGVAAEAICNFTVRFDKVDRGEKGIAVYSTASNPTPIEDTENYATGEITTAEQMIKAVMSKTKLAPFVGILLNKIDGYDYSDEMFELLGNDTFGFIKHASTSKKFTIAGVSKKTNAPYSFEKGVDYEGSDFQIAWDAYKGKGEGAKEATVANAKEATVVNAKEKTVDNLDSLEGDSLDSGIEDSSFEDDFLEDDCSFGNEPDATSMF